MQVAELIKELKREFLPSSIAASLSAEVSSSASAPSSTSGLGLSAMLTDRRVLQNCQPGCEDPDSPEVVVNVNDSLGSTAIGSEASDEDDSYLWDSWKRATGGTHSWRQRMRHRREPQEQDSDNVSYGSEDKSLSYRSSDSESMHTNTLGGEAPPQSALVQAGASDVVEYAKYLGIDPLREPHLLRIAEEGLQAPLPDGWSEHEDSDGNIYYHHVASEQSVWQHPLDNFYKDKVVRERARLKERRRHREGKSRKTASCSEAAAGAATQFRGHAGPVVI